MASKELAKLWLIPQDGEFMVDASSAIAFNGKRFAIGRGIGNVTDGIKLTEIATLVLNRLCAYSQVEATGVWLVEIANEARIETRLRRAFTDARNGTTIMVVCRTSELIDALLPYLVWQPGFYPR